MKSPTFKHGECVQIERGGSTTVYRYDYGNDLMAVFLDSNGNATAFNLLFYGKTWKIERRGKAMDFKWENYQTLITVPATDCNFKAALKNADDDELSRAEKHMTDNPFANKTRLKAVQREIRKRGKKDVRQRRL